MQQQSAFPVSIRRVVLHEGCRGLVAQKGADQIDMDDLGEEVSGHRAVLPEHSPRTDHAGAVDQQVDAAHPLLRDIHGGVDFGFGGDIATQERGTLTERRCRGLARSLLHIQDDNLPAV